MDLPVIRISYFLSLFFLATTTPTSFHHNRIQIARKLTIKYFIDNLRVLPALGGGCNGALLLCFRLIAAVLNNSCFVSSRSVFVHFCSSLTPAATVTNSFASITVVMDAHALLSAIVLQYNQCMVYSRCCAQMHQNGMYHSYHTALFEIIYFFKTHGSVHSCTETHNVVNMLRSSHHSFRIHINALHSVTLFTGLNERLRRGTWKRTGTKPELIDFKCIKRLLLQRSSSNISHILKESFTLYILLNQTDLHQTWMW